MNQLIAFLFLVSFKCVYAAQEGIYSPPNLIPELEETNWENATRVIWEYVNNNTAIFSKDVNMLTLDCTANYPIEWNITGIIRQPEFIKMQPYKREILNGGNTFSFVLKLLIFFDETEPKSSSSSKIQCQSVEQPEKLKSSLGVFLRGPKPFVHSEQVIKVNDSSLIPCPVTDPTQKVSLFRSTPNRGPEKVNERNYIYDPLQGFQFPVVVEGDFTCIAPNDGVTIFARITKPLVPGSRFHPKERAIKVFVNDRIQLDCSTEIKLIQGENITLEKVSDSTDLKSILVKSETNTSGTFGCLSNNKEIWTWEIDFIEPPMLYLDNFEGEVDCLSDDPTRSVSTVRCINPSHCEYMKHCFSENETNCNHKKQQVFKANALVAGCWVQEKGSGADCASVPYSHLNGLAECYVSGLKKYWQFFVSLDFLRYSNWEKAPKSGLIRMDEVNETLYTNYTTTFFCQAVSYLFADSLAFSIEYANKSMHFLDRESYNNPGIENSRKIDEFNVLGELNINLTIDAVAIHCHAPWWNSTEFMSVERRFVTKHLLHPEIIRSDYKPLTLISGEKGRRLNCSAIGEPQPSYKWFKDDQLINESSQFSLASGSRGESLLEFKNVDESDKDLLGTYICQASNYVGFVNTEFILENVQAEGSHGKVIYGATVGIILLILAFVVCLLGAVFTRYKKARDLLRGLTENEIEEFFHGKPELASSYHRLTAENLDLMPYDRQYEIDLEDIDFDSSNVLGSGEFSFVVKGRFKSKMKDVAVKIAKPSADVTLFKSLLSEVKIMIYIGKHNNIVQLIGVCTQGIQNRNIHIIMELCEGGSLESKLRKGRKNFQNLIDQNQSIDPTLIVPEIQTLNTLDLIRWAGQIAKGMEYLSFKGVVHADLAARNVLLDLNSVAKISDFGLSKKLYECNNYVKKTKSVLPWRWMAIESLTTLTFSTESDCWSYGVTLFEIFSLGDVPFPNESWNKEFVTRLASGMRMGKPKFATPEIYSKIGACWDEDISLRPQFTTLRKYFFDLLKSLQPDEGDHYDLMSQSDNKTETESTFVSEDGENSQPKETSTADLYTNIDPEGQPQYTNFDPTGQPMYSNVL